MDGIEVCEICGEYVNEGDLTECKSCRKKGCELCIDYDDLLCEKCWNKQN